MLQTRRVQRAGGEGLASVVSLPTALTQMLLRHFRWDKDKLTEAYMSDPEGVGKKGASASSAPRTNPSSTAPRTRKSARRRPGALAVDDAADAVHDLLRELGVVLGALVRPDFATIATPSSSRTRSPTMATSATLRAAPSQSAASS